MKEPLQHPTDSKVRRGFTLLETLLVLGLLSMLAAVLIGGSASLLNGTARSDPEMRRAGASAHVNVQAHSR